MEHETPAEKVIRLFGLSRVAEITGLSTVQIHRWKYPKGKGPLGKGGHDGQVPPKHHQALLLAAQEAGVDLTPSDLMPWLSAEPAQQKVA